MNITDKTIGLLAVTPEGGAKAYKELTLAYYRKYGDYVSPHIILYTQPLINHVKKFGEKKEWSKLIQQGVNRLRKDGAEVIWMPANSSHLVIDKVKFGKTSFVNMVELSLQYLEKTKHNPLVLGTNVSLSDMLYFKDPTIGKKCVKPDRTEQDRLNDIIVKELVLGKLSPSSKTFIKNLVSKYRKKANINLVFLACTELPCFFSEQDFGILTQNSISVTIDHFLSKHKFKR